MPTSKIVIEKIREVNLLVFCFVLFFTLSEGRSLLRRELEKNISFSLKTTERT